VDLVKPGRKQLVGLLTCDGRTLLEEGAQIVRSAADAPVRSSDGHVTSSYYSDCLRRPIALALVADGRNRLGSIVHVPMPKGAIEAKIVSSVFYDPKGERIHV
jgi:sarcosine oxidase subunit alpha